MADLTPNNREEYWLQGMVDGQTTLEPNKRREYWYKEIVDAIGSGGGGGGGSNIIEATLSAGAVEETAEVSLTWQEIHDYMAAGKTVRIKNTQEEIADYIMYTGFADIVSAYKAKFGQSYKYYIACYFVDLTFEPVNSPSEKPYIYLG